MTGIILIVAVWILTIMPCSLPHCRFALFRTHYHGSNIYSVVLLLTKCSLIARGEEWRNGFCVCVCLRLLSSLLLLTQCVCLLHCVIGFALSLSPCLLPAVPPACQCNTDRSASCGPLQPHPNHFWQRSQLRSFPTLKFLYTFRLGTALSLPTSGTRLSSLFRPSFEINGESLLNVMYTKR